MELSGNSVNSIYSIKDKSGEDFFFEKWEAASIFSANPLLIYFFKEPVSSIKSDDLDLVKSSFLNIYELQTPYIYKPFETGVHEGYLFFTYLNIENITLRTLMDAQIVLPMTIYLKIIINVLRALVKLEGKGISHNLITPDTVWLTETGPEITNIKLSGVLDYLLWPHLGSGKDLFVKEYSRYLRKEFRLSKKITPGSANDIYTSGVILYELIRGQAYKPSEGLSFPKETPKWLSDLTESMINNPENFATVEDLLDVFLSKAPERSILEDSIENRIVETHQGENFSKLMDPEEEALPVEELEPGESDQANKPSVMVKNIVSFIFSLFRKKKKRTEGTSEETIPAATEEPDSRETETVSNNDDKGEIGIDPPDSAFEQRITPSSENKRTIDPWEIDSSRYKETEKVVAYRKQEIQTGTGKRKESKKESIDEERTYGIAEKSVFAQPKEQTADNTGFMTAEEKIKAMNKHREKGGTAQIESTADVSTDRNRILKETEKNGPASSEPEKIQEEGKDKSFPGETGSPPEESPETEHPGKETRNETIQEKSFFSRLLEWIKKVFFRK